MYGDISDEEANRLILLMENSIRKGLLGRTALESKLFPVNTYICVAQYILYDQTFQYNVVKRVIEKIRAEDLGKRCKTLGSYLNQLAFHAFAMLYLHGRASVIYDEIRENKSRATPEPLETEEQKHQTKILLDYWRHLSPNYRNDGYLLAEDAGDIIQILPQKIVEKFYSEMKPVQDRKFISNLKRTTALLTNYNFLFQAECRAGIFEHGPYSIEGNDEVIFFKEFQFLYSGDEIGGINVSQFLDHIKTEKVSPVGNVIFGFALRDMEEAHFSDWGTSFFKPPDYTENITAIGIWTKDYTHPKEYRWPDKLGSYTPLKFDILKELQDYAQNGLNELYMKIVGWDYLKRLMLGVNLYSNAIAFYTAYAGIEDEFEWTWPQDVLEDKQKNDLVNIADVKRYIKTLEKMPGGAHPFMAGYFRSKKRRMKAPTLYYITK